MHDAAYTVADQQRMTRAVRYFDWQAKLALPHLGRRVLEIGCGIGNFTPRLLDRELVVSIDDEPACIEHLGHRFPNQSNLITLVRDGAEPLSDLRPHRLDSCVCLNVLEHIENDLATLRNIAAALQPASSIVLILPAFAALTGPIDKRLGHHRRYTRASLAALATGAGLAIRQARYMNLPGWFGWWFNAHVLKLEAQSEAQIAFFDRFLVPVISRAESLIPPPFGQSLFAVLSKPTLE